MVVQRDRLELKIASPERHRELLAYAIRQASMTYEEVAKLVTPAIKGKLDKGFVSWYLKGVKTVDAERVEVFAKHLAGKGALADDSDALLLFLLGLEEDPKTILSLRVVTSSLCYPQRLSDLVNLDHASEEQSTLARATADLAA